MTDKGDVPPGTLAPVALPTLELLGPLHTLNSALLELEQEGHQERSS